METIHPKSHPESHPESETADGLVTLVDGTCKLRSELTPDEAEELRRWNRARAGRARVAAQRREAGQGPLCSYYLRDQGDFCPEEGTHIGRGNEAGMRKLDFCERHLKTWFV